MGDACDMSDIDVDSQKKTDNVCDVCSWKRKRKTQMESTPVIHNEYSEPLDSSKPNNMECSSTKPEENGYECIAMPTVLHVGSDVGSSSQGSALQLPRLPTSARRSPTVTSSSTFRSGASASRQLNEILLELKQQLDIYTASGVYLGSSSELGGARGGARNRINDRPIRGAMGEARGVARMANSTMGGMINMEEAESGVGRQNNILRGIGDATSCINDVIHSMSYTDGSDGSRRSRPVVLPPRLPNLPAPMYLAEHLASLRDRIDRLSDILERRTTRRVEATDAAVRLQALLVNVRASVNLAVDSIGDGESSSRQQAGVQTRRRPRLPLPSTADGYERVRRPNRRDNARRSDVGSRVLIIPAYDVQYIKTAISRVEK
jgi:hypothetical protein